MPEPTFEDLGRIDYPAALARQRQTHRDVVAGAVPGVVYLLEHDPVVTIGRRREGRQNLIVSEAQLQQHGVALAETDRGGDITYHGPGQLVAYPIIPLHDFRLNLRSYVRLLEHVIIDTLSRFDIAAHRDRSAVGVWVGGELEADPDTGEPICTSGGAKIAAIGVRIQRWVTMHGLALNVSTQLDHFNLIVPCGLAGRSVTSMTELLGDRCPDMAEVKATLQQAMLARLAASTEATAR